MTAIDTTQYTIQLESAIRQQDRTLAGIKHFLKVAAEYRNDDPVKRMDGIQAALKKASEYEGRSQQRGRR